MTALPAEMKGFLQKVKEAGYVSKYGTIKQTADGTIYSGFKKITKDDPEFFRQVLLQCDMINTNYLDEDVFEFLGMYPPGGAVVFE